jgi:hypothetical protein
MYKIGDTVVAGRELPKKFPAYDTDRIMCIYQVAWGGTKQLCWCHDIQPPHDMIGAFFHYELSPLIHV